MKKYAVLAKVRISQKRLLPTIVNKALFWSQADRQTNTDKETERGRVRRRETKLDRKIQREAELDTQRDI